MDYDEIETRRRYPQAEAKTIESAKLPGDPGEWVILSGIGPMAAVIGRGACKEDAWAAASRLARADSQADGTDVTAPA